MKKTVRLLGLLLLTLMIVGLWPADASASAVTEVNNVKVTITAPKVGELPRYDAKVAEGWKSYVIHSEWSGEFDAYGRFQTGKKYTFTVTTRVNPTEGDFVYEKSG